MSNWVDSEHRGSERVTPDAILPGPSYVSGSSYSLGFQFQYPVEMTSQVDRAAIISVSTAGGAMFSFRYVAGSSYALNPNLLAAFTLERDEEGDFVFADVSGAMYGVGSTFLEAVSDWAISAIELEDRLQTVSGMHWDLAADHRNSPLSISGIPQVT
jgi:hypothetical protein